MMDWKKQGWMRMCLAAFLFASVASARLASVASSHAVELVRSEPQAGAILTTPPQQLKAWFNEELQTGESRLRVVAENGALVDLDGGGVDLTDPEHASLVGYLPEDLPDGLYTVRYHVVLLDGDSSDGQFYFYIGEEAAGAAKLAAIKSDTNLVGDEGSDNGSLLGSPAGLISSGVVGFLFVAGIVILAGRRKRPV